MYQNVTFRTIPSMYYPWNARKLSLFVTRRPKLGQYWPKSNSFLEMVRIHHHDTFQTIPSLYFLWMPWNSNFIKFLATRGPKLGQNQITFEGDQDISAYHISGNSFHAFPLECPETPTSLNFGPLVSKTWATSGQKSYNFLGGQDTSACHILSNLFHGLSVECPETSISHFLATKRPTLGQYRPKSNNLWGWSGYISMPYFGPFLQSVLLRMLGNVTGRTCGRTDADQRFDIPIQLRRRGQLLLQ